MKPIICLLPLLATAAIAGGYSKTEIRLSATDGGEPIEVAFEDVALDFEAMQVGESQSLVDRDGQNVLVTRNEDNLTFNVDGRTAEAPLLRGIHDIPSHANVEVFDMSSHAADSMAILNAAEFHGATALDETMIISASTIDPATQAAIKDLLRSAGVEGEVRFVDASDSGKQVVKVERRQTIHQ